MFNAEKSKSRGKNPAGCENLAKTPNNIDHSGRKLSFYENYLKTPNIDDRDIIEKIVAKLKEAFVYTELHNIEDDRLKTGERVKHKFGSVMAMLKAADYLSIERCYEQKHRQAKVEIIRRLEMLYRDFLFSMQDVHQLMQNADDCSFARLFEIYQSIDLRTFIDMYCSDSAAKELLETMTSYYPRPSDRPEAFSIGNALIPAASYANNVLLMDNKNIFFNNDSKTVYDLNVNPQTISYIIDDELSSDAFVLMNLLVYPLYDDFDYQYYLDLCGAYPME